MKNKNLDHKMRYAGKANKHLVEVFRRKTRELDRRGTMRNYLDYVTSNKYEKTFKEAKLIKRLLEARGIE